MSDTHTHPAIFDVDKECKRQDRLKAEGRFKHHCGDAEMSDGERYLVLAEEFGEVARALLEKHGLANDKHDTDVRKELIQVAAVCVKWVTGIDRRALEEHIKAGRTRT